MCWELISVLSAKNFELLVILFSRVVRNMGNMKNENMLISVKDCRLMRFEVHSTIRVIMLI